eukprot:Pgem_evm2s663
MLRYLRDYLESAYIRKEITLTDEQIWAMDMLDCVAQISDVQLRYNLKAGETLLCTDVSVLHGRTPFVDYTSAKQLYDQNAGKNRLLQRTWFKENWVAQKLVRRADFAKPVHLQGPKNPKPPRKHFFATGAGGGFRKKAQQGGHLKVLEGKGKLYDTTQGPQKVLKVHRLGYR